MKSPLRYKTAGDNIVTWTLDEGYPHGNDPFGDYACGGCGKTDRGFASTADKHARNCRVL